ncbi:MAG: PAS domain S-box protein [Chloroflexi bacterium]|nr:PAS domain S-box protein [Chloroflexota bacterium]
MSYWITPSANTQTVIVCTADLQLYADHIQPVLAAEAELTALHVRDITAVETQLALAPAAGLLIDTARLHDDLDTLDHFREQQPELKIFLLAEHSNDPLIAEAIQRGATDYLLKEQSAWLLRTRVCKRIVVCRERRQLAQQVRQLETQFQNIIVKNADGVLVVDADGIVRFCNPAAEALFGQPRSELNGQEFGFPLVIDETTELDLLHSSGDVVVAEMRAVETEWLGQPALLATLRNVTKRKLTEEALRRAVRENAQLAAAIKDLPVGVLITDPHLPDNPVTFANAAFSQITGYDLAEIVGRNCRFLQGEHTDPTEMERIRTAITEASPFAGTVLNYRKDRTPFWNELIINPVFDQNGSLINFVGLQTDVTARIDNEAALRRERERLAASERELRMLFDNAFDAIVVYDDACVYTDANPAAEPVFGLPYTDLIGTSMRSYIHADDADVSFDDIWTQFLAQGYAEGECTIHQPGGATRLVEFKSKAHFLPGRHVSFMQDVTERRRLEAAERQQRMIAETLTETAAVLNRSLDLSEVLDHILAQVARVVPYDAATVMLRDGETVYSVRSAGYAERGADNAVLSTAFPLKNPVLQQMFSTGQPLVIDDVRVYLGWVTVPETEWIRGYAGTPIHLNDEIIGFINLDSETPGAFTAEQVSTLQTFAHQAAIAMNNARLWAQVNGYAQDLERRVAERTAQLRESKERAEAILHSSSDGVAVLSHDGVIKQANPAFALLFHATLADIVGMSWLDFVSDTDADQLLTALQAVAAIGRDRRIEIVAQRLDQTNFDADVVLSPFREANEHVTGVVFSVRDISRHKRIETSLRASVQRERELNELKSRFVSMVTHEFRTPLAAIKLSVGMLQTYDDRQTRETRLERLNRIEQQVEHLTDLMENMLALSRSEHKLVEQFHPQPTDLLALGQTVVEEMRALASAQHTIAFSAHTPCPPAHLDGKLLRRALINLLGNALKYSPNGGLIQVGLRCEDGHVELTVEDEGLGIPHDDLERIFEAFHRAKNTASISGTGLGLAIVHQIVELHKGSITVESEVGQGTRFTIALPHHAPPLHGASNE